MTHDPASDGRRLDDPSLQPSRLYYEFIYMRIFQGSLYLHFITMSYASYGSISHHPRFLLARIVHDMMHNPRLLFRFQSGKLLSRLLLQGGAKTSIIMIHDFNKCGNQRDLWRDPQCRAQMRRIDWRSRGHDRKRLMSLVLLLILV
jgi:hypothetical protein